MNRLLERNQKNKESENKGEMYSIPLETDETDKRVNCIGEINCQRQTTLSENLYDEAIAQLYVARISTISLYLI